MLALTCVRVDRTDPNDVSASVLTFKGREETDEDGWAEKLLSIEKIMLVKTCFKVNGFKRSCKIERGDLHGAATSRSRGAVAADAAVHGVVSCRRRRAEEGAHRSANVRDPLVLESLARFHAPLRIPDEALLDKVQEKRVAALEGLPQGLGSWSTLLALRVDHQLGVSTMIYTNSSCIHRLLARVPFFVNVSVYICALSSRKDAPKKTFLRELFSIK